MNKNNDLFSLEEIEKRLWMDVKEQFYLTGPELYQKHIIEQYKIYIEMTDRISSRRNLANVFFLTLHTMIIAAIGFTVEKVGAINPKWIIFFPLIGIITLCLVWWWLIKSYRNLNTAKFKVIGLLEKRLPASPYYSAEWKALGEGKNYKTYLPLTAIEQWVPIIFCLMYILLGVYFLLI